MTKKIQCPFCYKWRRIARGKTCSNPDCMAHKYSAAIPEEAFTHKLFPIVIAGASSSGKTHFLTALLHRLRESFWKEYWQLNPIDYNFGPAGGKPSETNPYCRNDLTLFTDRQTLSSTQAIGPHPPLLLSLSYRHPMKHCFNEPVEPWRKRRWLIAITDTAGEDSQFDSIDQFDEKYAAAKHARGLIVMVDSAKMMVDPDYAANEAKNFTSKQVNKKFNVPTAICLSKIDELVSEDSDLAVQCMDVTKDTDVSVGGKLSLPDIYNRSRDIMRFLREKKGECASFERTVEGGYDYYAFFGVSALGLDPFKLDENGNRIIVQLPSGEQGFRLKQYRPQKGGNMDFENRCLQPRHVLDPLLWILWQNGLLGGIEKKEGAR